MISIFKESKNQPIKFRNFNFIGCHPDYPVAYYYKRLDRDNYELMECVLEGNKKPEIGPGTTVKVLDAFMTNYLYLTQNGYKLNDNKEFIKKVIDNTYYDFKENVKTAMLEKFTSPIPRLIRRSNLLKKLSDDGFEVLYCSDDETEDRKMGIVNITLVKEEHVKSEDKKIAIDRKFTIFKPLKYRVLPSYIKGESDTKYMEEEYPPIVICRDILK